MSKSRARGFLAAGAAASAAVGALALTGYSPNAEGSGEIVLRVVPGTTQSASGPDSVQARHVKAQATSASALTAADFATVDGAVDASVIPNMTLIIGDADGILHVHTKGNFDPNAATDLASGSKWLFAAMAIRMVQAGKANLGDHPQQYLTFWTTNPSDNRRTMTLDHLMSMRSGFNAGPLAGGCVSNGLLYTLQSCAQTIHNQGVDTAPGAAFSYGPHHMQVAAAMLEKAGNKSFNSLFAEYLTTPLGMTKTKYTKASAANPWIAGGAQSSAYDYAKMLQAFLGTSFITDMDDFTGARTIGLPRPYVPGDGDGHGTWQYAIGSFVECDDTPPAGQPARPCATAKINSSPGANGWLGWIDREHGYYGLIATRVLLSGSTKAVTLEQQLQPLILDALNP
ncbi:serine hydrolase domain-containing protein [Sphingomonas alpina]|uniref:Beta-lactamase family protein n=1 Tax=Sphingomonas alpina TaxID=653931 RepID=A0A7H0LE77_9SPHN|nr:serine hydrolase domain-containing protein [Sphingomonas alpina]QNQ07980.1 beta-lactamase family protein [Sphingomonas alpina]